MLQRSEKVLITVKTYPVLSVKYNELVCTAGINEQGEWIRLYPIQFRQLHLEKQYRKWQYVEAMIVKSNDDMRPESHRPEQSTLEVLEGYDEGSSTSRQRKIEFLEKTESHTDMKKLIEMAHQNKLSLALFEPSKIERFYCEPDEREWGKKQLEAFERQKRQFKLFNDGTTVAEDFRNIQKLPYKFKYGFKDENGRTSNMEIFDWEIGALYWNCLKSVDGNEDLACEKVKQKYFDEFVGTGKYSVKLILGTTLDAHRRKLSNPFTIIGVVYLSKADLALLSQGKLPLEN